MSRFVPGWIRQLTERQPPDETFKLTGTSTGRLVTGHELRAQQNIRIQSCAADIVSKLIAAEIIPSQRADQVDEIIRDILFKAFGGTGLEHPPQPIVKSR